MRKLLSLAIVLLVCPLFAAQPAADRDDCDARFVAAIGSDAYQFSPLLEGELGTARLYAILSYNKAAAMQRYGRAFWEVDVVGPFDAAQGKPDDGGRLVYHADGIARIGERGAALAETWWDGRDQNGDYVDPGLYSFTFRARFAPNTLKSDRPMFRYDDVLPLHPDDEAFSSVGELVVDYALDAQSSLKIRATVATSCQIQQNAPLEAGFGYNYYYGSTHSHSNYSDGGQPTSSCSSGNGYGSGNFDPAAVFNYARNTAGMDYWLVNEHNHLIDDALGAGKTEAAVKARYAAGRTAATNATVSGSFVALYGMEWGVLTNSDQGHVTLIETPKLFGWETCSNCNGAAAECTPGTNCYFDLFTPKRFAYLTLYQRSVENPSTAGALGIFCHPDATHFDGFAFNANADAAMQGIAVRSGLAFNTATDCASANVASTNYVPRWNEALAKGFHLAPTADHDAHCDNFGTGLPTRTVYLLPNNVSPALTKSALMAAHKARRFFASEDANAQIVFGTSDGAHVMGEIFTGGASVTLRGAAYDPNGESVSRIELWRGQIGAAAPTAAYKTFTSVSSFTSTESASAGTQYWYYMRVVQADGNNVWSAPMWVTFGTGGGGTQSQLLLNPGFESGNVNWTATTGVITNDAGEAAQAGTWKAWLDGYGSAHTDSVYQTVTIPAAATAATLNFYLHIDTAETSTTTAFDTLQVQVRNTSNGVLATLATYSNLNKNTGYALKSFNLLAYKGQTIRVYFLGVEDGTLQTSFVVDSTALNVTQ